MKVFGIKKGTISFKDHNVTQLAFYCDGGRDSMKSHQLCQVVQSLLGDRSFFPKGRQGCMMQSISSISFLTL